MVIPQRHNPPTPKHASYDAQQGCSANFSANASRVPEAITLTPVTAASPKSLPVPSAEGISQFQRLYEQRFGTTLSESEALDLATRYLHLVYFATTPLPHRAEAKGEADE
jgi:hypothetical protein